MPTVPSQPTTLSQMGTIVGDLGNVGVPLLQNTPDTAAPISSKPGRFDQGPVSPWRTTWAWISTVSRPVEDWEGCPPLARARNLGLDDPRAVRPDSHCNFGDRSIRACRATAATQRKSRKRAVPCPGIVRHPRPGQANPADVTGQSATGVDGPRTTAAAIGRAGGDQRGGGVAGRGFPRPRVPWIFRRYPRP